MIVKLPQGIMEKFSQLYCEIVRNHANLTTAWLKFRELATKSTPQKIGDPIKIYGKKPEEEALATALLLLINPQLKPAPSKLSPEEVQIIRAIIEAQTWEPPAIIQYFTYLTAGMKVIKDKLGTFLVPEDFELTGDYAILDWEKYTQPDEPYRYTLVGYNEKFKAPIVERVTTQEYPGVVKVKQVEAVIKEKILRKTVSVTPIAEVEDLVEGTEGNLEVNAVIDEPVFYFEGVEYWTDEDAVRHAARFLFFGDIKGEFYYYTERAPGVVWKAKGVLSSIKPAEGLEAYEVTYLLVGGEGERFVRFYMSGDLLNRLAKHPKYKGMVALARA
ncbi:hypothetical protein [Thermococcus prieurii]